jgi:hypothetical protein
VINTLESREKIRNEKYIAGAQIHLLPASQRAPLLRYLSLAQRAGAPAV